ncbi:MAG: class I SAM-dependent methyltransferase, partial [Anaerolineae bacterium]|nr:class I SAM-dependent methyltransferase [Anaerolineae bacterium]
MSAPDYARWYDAYYYAHDCGRPYQRDPYWLAFFGAIADQIVARIAPRTVLDAGCAMGFLVEELRRRGVESYGVDISEYAIANVHPEVRPFCWVGSICDPFPQRYDLIVCMEILEHMPAAEAPKAIANLCQHTDDILFSSTPFDYKEVTHLNVQPPEHWAELFAQHGFFRDVDFDASFILPWAVRFRRKKDPPARLVREYERRFWQLWKENLDLRAQALELRDQLVQAGQAQVEAEQARTIATKSLELRTECEWL